MHQLLALPTVGDSVGVVVSIGVVVVVVVVSVGGAAPDGCTRLMFSTYRRLSMLTSRAQYSAMSRFTRRNSGNTWKML